MADAPKAEIKKGRTRSPAYPSFDLETAIAKIRLAYDANDRHPMAPESLAAYLKSSATSSSFLQAISTLKQFGLLDDTGWGDKRRLSVSNLALDILISEDDSPTKATAIKEAALNPGIHAEIWNKYKGKLPSKDESIRFYLLRERAEGVFNRTQVDGVIGEFRATIAFAQLSPDDKVDATEGDEPEQNDNGAGKRTAEELFSQFGNLFPATPRVTAAPQTLKPESPKPEVSGKQMRDLAIPLIGGEVAYLRVPVPLSEDNYDYLLDHIKLFKRGIVATPAAVAPAHAQASAPGAVHEGSQKVGSVPFMITHEMRKRLGSLGYTDDDIRYLTPAEANEIIAIGEPKSE